MRFILLHSPLLGPRSWSEAAQALRDLGHQAETPAWTPLADVRDGYYRSLARDMAAEIADGPAPVLVAHSSAGALLPALVEAMAAPAGVIFADAILPHPGTSWFDTAPAEFAAQLRGQVYDGNLPAWDDWWPPGALERLVPDASLRERLVAEAAPIPVKFFEEPAPEVGLTARLAYLQLSGAYQGEAEAAGRWGWPLISLPLHHLGMLTHPEAVARALDALAGRLESASRG